MKQNVLFICIFNVKRSVIAEHLLRRLLNEKGAAFADAIDVFSAGFLGEETSKWFENNAIPYPVPLFDRAPSDFIRSIMSGRGVDLSQHRSKPVTEHILHQANIIIPLLEILKRDLAAVFPESEGKIFLPNEFLKNDKCFFWEDTSNVPSDGSMFEFAHNDPHYVNTVIDEIEEFIAEAFDSIVHRVLFQNKAS